MDNTLHGQTWNLLQHRIPDRVCGLPPLPHTLLHRNGIKSQARNMLLVRINRNLSLPHRQRFPRVTATSTDRSIPDYHPAPFHNGSISRDPVPLRIADGITILPIVPVKRRSRATLATTAVICGIQCRCGIWRKEKGLPDAAVARTLRKMQIFCTALGFCAIWTTSTYTGAPRLCKSNKFICTALGFCAIWTTSTYTGAPRLCKSNKFICTALGFCAIWTLSTYTGAPRLCKSNKFICTALGFCVYLRHEK